MSSAHRPLIITAATALAAGAVLAAPAVAQRTDARSYALPERIVQPEGIATAGGSFYTGSRVNGTIAVGSVRTGTTRILARGGVRGRTSSLGMEVAGSTLWVAGGPTGRVFALDRRTGATKAVFRLTGAGDPFVNDLVIKGGAVYVTDSLRPQLYRIARSAVADGGTQDVASFLGFAGTPLTYVEDENNLNGIEVSGGDLLSVQSSTGKLWKIDPGSKEVSEVAVTGGPLTNGDGLLVQGRRLYVVQNALRTIARLQLGTGDTAARVTAKRRSSVLPYPTTIARSGGSFLLPNARFDKEPGTVDYTVGSVPRF